MDNFLSSKLREYAAVLRSENRKGKSLKELEVQRQQMLSSVYKILAIYLGEPPETFDWAFKDKDGKPVFHEDLTPQQFYKEFVHFDLDEKVCLMNAPQESKPFYKNYSLRLASNVIEEDQGRFLNLPMEKLTDYTRASIEDEEAVWFGCDVAQNLSRSVVFDEEGFDVLDTKVLTHDLLFGTECKMGKGERLDYRQGQLSHAMVFTGVNIKEGRPDFWSVENSWGDKHASHGFLTMSQEWFEEHVYQVIIDKKYLSDEEKALLEEAPVVLDPWDPIG